LVLAAHLDLPVTDSLEPTLYFPLLLLLVVAEEEMKIAQQQEEMEDLEVEDLLLPLEG
jgi:hypothetical protein